MGQVSVFDDPWYYGRAKAMVLEGASSTELARSFGVSRDVALRLIHRIVNQAGEADLKPKQVKLKQYTPEVRIQAVEAVLGGESKREVVQRFELTSVKTLEPWIRKYREGGPQALYGKHGYVPVPYEDNDAARLRRIQQLEAENAYLKALAAGKWGHL